MKSEVILKSETGESVAAVYHVQESGRIAIADALLSLNIKKEDWKNTWVQAILITLPGPEKE
ncbi:MAG: hypothetical protein KAI70_00355 [Candidatus Omnitrophica bacterium]|nr:hypothetical protein [Candidatus Omnitrophota bacterium]